MSKGIIIAAMSQNRVIGRDGGLPWNLPDDHAHFWKVADGHPFIMGRKSFEADDALLSKVKNIVLTSKNELTRTEPHLKVNGPKAAQAAVPPDSTYFVLGGESVFEAFVPLVDTLILTEVEAVVEGDTFFPKIDWTQWTKTQSTYHPVDDNHAYAFHINRYERKP